MEPNSSFAVLLEEVAWLQSVIDQAIKTYLMHEGHENNWQDIPMPDLNEIDCSYSNAIMGWELNNYSRLALVLAIAPHVKPEILDVFLSKNQIYDKGFTEFGGVIDKNHSGFLPTGQTLSFLISAGDPLLKVEALKIFEKDSMLIKNQVISLSETESYIPNLNGILSVEENWIHYFLVGTKVESQNSTVFPAQKITTNMNWEDVVLDHLVMEQVQEINKWLTHGETLMKDWGLFKKIKQGYKVLFCGPPGTGKTLTATLIGKAAQRDVYQVDLSMVVSKYIGETEKNLAKIFDTAANKDWILFFDEADALFGKRTAANTSNDRHANQQTAYLLQKIEDFPGVVILASNLRANMDDAFTRRFQSIVNFKMPSVSERYQLWQNAFDGVCGLHDEVDLHQISEHYELAGGSIINVLRHCALSAISRGDTLVNKHELLAGIKKEYRKENKTISMLN
jgi:AAA+ superfamily predicted ATPase